MKIKVFGSRLALAVFSVLAGLLVFGSAANATQPECKVINQTQDVAYNSNASTDPLGSAISRARSGDTLKVIGTCYGNFVIDKDLTITGRPSSEHRDVIDGNGSGFVLMTTAGIELEIDHLVIRNGNYFAYGGGISNDRATLLVSDTIVTGNEADSGGGIFNGGGTVTLVNSTVAGNTAGYSSGGIENNNYNDEVGTLTLVNSIVSNNSAFKFGGLSNYGVATITDSTMSGNTAERGGGGISNSRTLVLTRSLVAANFSDMGGGIWNDGSAALTDTRVTGNTASITGGGIFNSEGFGTYALYGRSTVSGNAPNAGQGEGVHHRWRTDAPRLARQGQAAKAIDGTKSLSI